ncbi:MAG: hypothetical protein ACLGIZ_00325 [Acidimicrobiia bacterium]
MGGAFTAGGITNNAGTSEFVGGSVDQTITGATLSSVVHDVDHVNNKINSVTLTFGDAATAGKVPVITFTGSTANGNYTCAPVTADSHVSLCSPTDPLLPEHEANSNVSGLDILVPTA